MNNQQKIFVWVGLALVAVVLYFPPWLYVWDNPLGKEADSAGYHPIFNPPIAQGEELGALVKIDTLRLGAEVFVMVFIIGMMIMFFRN